MLRLCDVPGAWCPLPSTDRGASTHAGYRKERALYESVCMSFLTQLGDASAKKLMGVIKATSFAKGLKPKELNHPPRRPGGRRAGTDDFVCVEQYWLRRGSEEPRDPAVPNAQGELEFVIVPSVRRHIQNLARAVLSGRHPVLLQGPTSSGKTTMVSYVTRSCPPRSDAALLTPPWLATVVVFAAPRYLAARTGHKCVRINNHEHTDLQEYVGTYVTDSSGKLVFQEGALVTAMRAGHWIILDELNLAPTEVLEALNRLLDDNRELFIAETLETVKPHPNFMLWATQNPAGVYGGRKQLSQALKNRFLELHVDDIPGASGCGAVAPASDRPPC